MPYYLVTCTTDQLNKHEAIVEYTETNLDKLFLKLQGQAETKFGNLIYFDVVMVSQHSPLLVKPSEPRKHNLSDVTMLGRVKQVST